MKVCFLNPQRHEEKFDENFNIRYPVSRFSRGVDLSYNNIIPPSELATLAAVVKEAGHDVKILDANALGLLHRETCEWIRKQNPDLLVIKAGDTTFTDDIIFYHYAEGLGIKTILWEDMLNPAYSQRLVKDFNIKNMLYGEPEEKIFEFLNGKIGVIGGGIVRDLNKLPIPLFEELPMEKYVQERKKTWYSFLERGCGWGKCKFCLMTASENILRMRKTEHIAKEMDRLKEYGIERVFFWGPELNVSEKRALNVAELMSQYPMEWECWARVDNVSEDMLKKLKQSGCFRISFGVENGDQAVLDSYNKGITVDQIRRAFKLSKKVGLDTIAFVVMGTPYETPETFKKTIKFLKEIKPSLIAPANYRPFPNVELTKIAEERGLIEKEPYQLMLNADCTGIPISCRTMAMNIKELEHWTKELRKVGTKTAYKTYMFRPREWKRTAKDYFIRKKRFSLAKTD